MAWYHEAVFYHIYPLGLLGAPKQNAYEEPVHRLRDLSPWIGHIADLGFTGLYIGPLFQSVGHGYETTDYRLVDSRLGTNEDLRELVRACRERGIHVVLDGVFNHTGRDFFAYRDIREKRESSPYCGWYRGLNFRGNNSFGDGFSCENWGGFDLLPRLDARCPQVREYILETVRFWVREFGIDGIRLDAADVLDMDLMRALRGLANEIGPEFWLMGEVIHGEYQRWVNDAMLHSVTDYAMHKALFSGHNDHNYFEIAHTLDRTMRSGIAPQAMYRFVDNHDVDRIMSKLSDRRHWLPVHVLLFCLPGIPSVYYGSEFGIEGKKERGSDDPLRPCLDLAAMRQQGAWYAQAVRTLAMLRRREPDLVWGDYRQLILTTRLYAFARGRVLVCVNNDGQDTDIVLPASERLYRGVLGGGTYAVADGHVALRIPACGAEILVPVSGEDMEKDGEEWAQLSAAHVIEQQLKVLPAGTQEMAAPPSEHTTEPRRAEQGKSLEDMTVEELQAEVLARLSANGPLTDRMRREVAENVWRDSLLNWVRSFR